jgi:hypothetical protein
MISVLATLSKTRTRSPHRHSSSINWPLSPPAAWCSGKCGRQTAAGQVQIRFGLTEPGTVQLEVFNMRGSLVARTDAGLRSPGIHVAEIAARGAGAFVVRMKAGNAAYSTTARAVR